MMPWGPDGKWMREGVLGKVLGDWQVTGVFSAISGTPIDFTASATGLRAPGNTQTPNVNGTPEVLGGIGSGALWFDTSVSSAPANNTWGNVERRGLLTGPAYYNLDASIVKIIRFGSRRAVSGRTSSTRSTSLTMPIPTARWGTQTSGASRASSRRRNG